MNYNEMHPTFWNSLIDHNLGTKSLFDLKQNKTKQNIIKMRVSVCYYAIISILVGELNFGIQASYTPFK